MKNKVHGFFSFLCIVALLLIASVTPCFAAASAWQSAEGVRVRLIAAVDQIGQNKDIPLALEIELESGWHTYWRSPGEAGLPPRYDWKASENDANNFLAMAYFFPAPHRYTAFGLETIGYKDHVVLPMIATLRKVAVSLELKGNLSLLVCSNICVPRNFDLELKIPEGTGAVAVEKSIIDAAMQTVPAGAEKSGIVFGSSSIAQDELKILVETPVAVSEPDVFMEGEYSIYFNKPDISFLDAGHKKLAISFKLLSPLPEQVKLQDLDFSLTFVSDQINFEQKFIGTKPIFKVEDFETNKADTQNILPQDGTTPAKIETLAANLNHVLSAEKTPLPVHEQSPTSEQTKLNDHSQFSETHGIGLIILFALIGGFILNLMPCVLPVLSLKVLNVISHGGGAKRRVRRSFLMTAAGILFSFFVLATVTVVFKQTGHMIGWGVQFQQPIFLVLLILLLTIFAANLWEQFEIALPRFLIDRIDPHYHPKLAGDFATGAFATLLATPCTAPFLGTAIGFALARGAAEIYIVFLSLGFGMILPYLTIAAWPRMAICLPKPGIWMVYLRRLLGCALAATAIWLLFVLSAEIAPLAVVAIAASTFFLLFILATWRRRFRKYKRLLPYVALVGSIVPFVIAFNANYFVSANDMEYKNLATASSAEWRAFDERAISELVGQGKVVFVDITADWCLTCKANKKFVLSNAEIRQALHHNDKVVAMQADWTNPNPTIAAFLQKYGRYGIPFNAVFGPAAPNGIILPELLSPSAIIDALKKADAQL